METMIRALAPSVALGFGAALLSSFGISWMWVLLIGIGGFIAIARAALMTFTPLTFASLIGSYVVFRVIFSVIIGLAQ